MDIIKNMCVKQKSPSPSGGGLGSGYHSEGGVTRNAQYKTIGNAKRLRKDLTEAEKLLWYHLRAKRFSNYKFRRQHAISQYIVDFVCLKSKLIIELDGGQHCAAKLYDTIRSAFLESLGFQVIRFWNNEVLKNTEGVLAIIAETLSPTLSLKGEGVICDKGTKS